VDSEHEERAATAQPNIEALREHGWLIVSTFGPYCTAWKDGEEIMLAWRNGIWVRLSGKASSHFDRS
jgi:hypothetical protein